MELQCVRKLGTAFTHFLISQRRMLWHRWTVIDQTDPPQVRTSKTPNQKALVNPETCEMREHISGTYVRRFFYQLQFRGPEIMLLTERNCSRSRFGWMINFAVNSSYVINSTLWRHTRLPPFCTCSWEENYILFSTSRYS